MTQKQNPFILLCILFLLTLNVQAQVGINKDNPDSCSILHISDSKRGVILPSISGDASMTTNSDGSFTPGLLYYNNTVNKFHYNNGTEWQVLNPWNSKSGSSEITTDKAVTAPTVNATKGLGITPIGGIIMWSGVLDNTKFDNTGKGINDFVGWAICNGSNETPDLRGRFIVGYDGSTYNIGSTGGSNSVTLTASNLPKHNHSVQGDGATINITNSGSHIHTGSTTAILKQGKTVGKNSGSGEGAQNDGAPIGGITIEESVHSHSNSSFSGIVGDGTNNGLGTATNIDIRPSFWSLLYIMRIQ